MSEHIEAVRVAHDDVAPVGYDKWIYWKITLGSELISQCPIPVKICGRTWDDITRFMQIQTAQMMDMLGCEDPPSSLGSDFEL